jgi:long-chain acyl-CoA synthetase
VNHPGNVRLGSVGRVIPGVTVKITTDAGADGADGEITVYGPNVMKGYHHRPDEQSKTFTSDGGLRTGDLGHLDEEGFLYITGRIKEQFKLDNGKYVAPSRLEEELKLSPYIANVMIHGANKPFNVAVVVIDADAVTRWARERGVTVDHPADDPRVRQLIRDEITARSSAFKEYEHVRELVLTTEDFTVENELQTPSLKLKRGAVVARYGAALEALYGVPVEH